MRSSAYTPLVNGWPSHAARRPNATLVGVKVSEILRLIGRDGWYLDRQRGSHRQYKHPNKRGLVTVSGKPSDDLHPKTRDSILRQAGLNEDGSQAEQAGRGKS
jgi:predicted RNA binding protein YcfA (HicA-like mRNA interferase family)